MPIVPYKIFKIMERLLLRQNFGRFHVVHAMKRLGKSLLKSNMATVNGHRMKLDRHDSLHLSIVGIHEPAETELI